jgi:hypothetical protein
MGLQAGAVGTAGQAPGSLSPGRATELATLPLTLTRITSGRNDMTTAQCACGFTEDEAGDQTIADHLLEAFAPEGDKGPDGLVHLEGERKLMCFCGLAAVTPEELDAHLLAQFTPDDAIGRDGKEHHPITAAANHVG